MIEYRNRKRNGEYMWVEASMRMFRDRRTGIPAGILSLVRDISERKRNESLLLKAYDALEALAVEDALTGVANRRKFDEFLGSEWSWSQRLQKPISLLLIDVDHFKLYNDSYGHLHGDNCLKQIAATAKKVATRQGDLVARFGGEEFAVVLPDTDNEGAIEVGQDIRKLLGDLCLPHAAIPEGFVTISVGCATKIAQLDEQPSALIQMADEALYHAKRNGRNQLCNANTMQGATPA